MTRSHRRGWPVVALLITSLLAACGAPAAAPTPTPIPPTSTPRPELPPIAYTSELDGNFDIYLIRPDGLNQQRVTQSAGLDWAPAISPDGTRLAFMSSRNGGQFDLFLLDIARGVPGAEANRLTALTNTRESEYFPRWSPDGTQLVFHGYPPDSQVTQIYTLDVEKALADADDAITRLTDQPANDGYANFSPTGEEIVFVSERDGNSELYVMNADGSNVRRLTDHVANDGFPAWHPDPNRRVIVFMSDRAGYFELYLLDLDRFDRGDSDALTVLEQPNRLGLTGNPGDSAFPVFSPDGNQLVFANNVEIGYDIYVLDLLTNRISRLTFDIGDDLYPDW
mgnify:CR=1 FL=1